MPRPPFRLWVLPLLLAGGSAFAQTAPALSPAARALVARAMEGLDPDLPLVDVHAHLVGLGTDGTGTWLNPRKFTWWHPLARLQTSLYIRATGVEDLAHFDRDYAERLVARARQFPRPLHLHLLAFDHAYQADGRPDLAHSPFYVPNEAVVALAERHPDLIVPVISLHPGRPDALQQLDRWADRGVRYLKWLPNAQGIDPADPRWDPFYRRMSERGVVLLSHAGEEQAVDAEAAQRLGNPLRFRRPLDLGVTVILAHGASLGMGEDLDHPGRKATNFELFLRLMDEPRYRGRLWGDLSAITQYNRLPGPLLTLLRRPDLQARMLNGSDYPLPGINLLIWTRKLKSMGLISAAERAALNELFEANPLLFDFVLKRTLRDRDGHRLEAAPFAARKELPDGRLVVR